MRDYSCGSHARKLLVPLSLTALVFAVRVIPAAAQLAGFDLQTLTGTWRENPSESRGTISKDLTYTFSQDADGFITIVRGGVQLRDRVRLDGTDYPTPGVPGRTTSWIKVSDVTYETTIKNGALTAKGRWTLSGDGRRLTQESTRTEPQLVTGVIEYVRKSGEGSSLIGEWEPVSSRTLSSEPDSFVVTLSEGTMLNVFFPRSGVRYTMRPDGKEYEARSNALPGMTAAVTDLGPRTLRQTTFRDHKPILEAVWAVSSDGRKLTVTSRTAGRSDEPSVAVYEKQD